MRSLSPLYTDLTYLPDALDKESITTLSIDTDTGKTYAVSESTSDGDVNIQIWTVDANEENHMIPLQDIVIPAAGSTTPQVVSCSIIPDTRTLCLIAASGDIAIAPLGYDVLPSLDIVGTVSPGPVQAAAFSPDYFRLAIITSTSTPTLILMDPISFEVLSSAPIITSDFGEEVPINVGWGSKTTQFHGSLGKQAAKESTVPSRSTTTPDDDLRPRISWRGDAKYFSVSLLQDGRRVLRVFDHQARLQSTAENVAGLEHPLAWRPNGSLIASTQRFGNVPNSNADENWALEKGQDGRHDVVFFERNGLRHGEFRLRESNLTPKESSLRCWAYRVHDLGWNADSSILSVWIERDDQDFIQLWTTGNYHWYLKLEMPAPGKYKRFTAMLWHPEDPFRLLCSTKDLVMDSSFLTYTISSLNLPPYDTGLVTVVDGDSLLLTPFRTQNVPPPMSSYQLSLSSPSDMSPPPVNVAFFTDEYPSTTEIMACLFADGTIRLWRIGTIVDKKLGKRDPLSIAELWRDSIRVSLPRQVRLASYSSGWTIAVVHDENGQDKLTCKRLVWQGDQLVTEKEWHAKPPSRRGRLLDSGSTLLWQTKEGSLFEVEDGTFSPVGSFSEFCPIALEVKIPSTNSVRLFVGQTSSKLIATANLSDVKSFILSRSCTSFTLAGSYLVWTATSPAHEAHFCRLDVLLDLLSNSESPAADAEILKSLETRRIERGARIVTSVPSEPSLVLQMPRGNLEIIMPRPLVIEQVKIDVRNQNYRSAFLACRKHRVDLNLLVEVSPETFSDNIPKFVQQLEDEDYINLFLTGLSRSDLSAELINSLCDKIKEELERTNIQKYVNSILTAYIVKKPSNYEAGLSLLLKLRENHPDLVEDAVKYIVFLVDVDKLFDTALGMYDFSLVLLVAQHSKKDPREYLPFLRSLHSLPAPYQYFKIDDHLKRYTKALGHLQMSGFEHFEEAKKYIEKHSLYRDALDFWRDNKDQFQVILELYGDYLFDRREFKEAAFAFSNSANKRKAMVAFEKALEWQELFDIAYTLNLDKEEITSIAYRITDDLSTKQRHSEAARIFLDYIKDVDEAVSCLIRGSAWSEARRIISLNNRRDLIDSLFAPGTLEAQSSIRDEIADIRDLLEKQIQRLNYLSDRRTNEPAFYFGDEDTNLGNVDVMTDVSNPGTLFTRYTVAPTASDRSKRTSRSKRKLDRKAGRKGTVQEEEYLLQSLTKLISRLEAVEGDARALLPHLLQLDKEHVDAAVSLQQEILDLEKALKTDIDQVWAVREEVTIPINYLEGTAGGTIKLLEKIPKPIVSDTRWKVSWLESSSV